MTNILKNPKVYIAGPYSRGDPEKNTRKAIEVGESLMRHEFVPFVPHLSHYWHRLYPHSYIEWLNYTKRWLSDCQAVLRLNGKSNGADDECKEAQRKGIPIFHSLIDLIEWRDNLTVLDLAKQYTSFSRQSTYGSPENNFRNISRYWNAYLKNKCEIAGLLPLFPRLRESDIGGMMVLFKMAREQANHDIENLADISGYARCVSRIEGDEE